MTTSATPGSLTVVMYHYVRDLPRTRFPKIKGMLAADFARQVAQLDEQFEMATLESSLALLRGEYQPTRPLCLLTFDDGLKDHFTDVLPVLAERRIQGQFFLITDCVENHRVADVHKNHFLMAALEFADYRRRFMDRLKVVSQGNIPDVPTTEAEKKYRWDTPDVAHFKFLLNFRLAAATRAEVLAHLFREALGDEAAFARELYVSWAEAQQMQAAGMSLGGHSHGHHSLESLSEEQQAADLSTCAALIRQRLTPQTQWPFSYPFGHASSYTANTIVQLRELGFACSFCTTVGENQLGQDLFSIRRIDPKDVPSSGARSAAQCGA